jgi:hypothetical protein
VLRGHRCILYNHNKLCLSDQENGSAECCGKKKKRRVCQEASKILPAIFIGGSLGSSVSIMADYGLDDWEIGPGV